MATKRRCTALLRLLILSFMMVATGRSAGASEDVWQERARQDLRFIHDVIASDHPGPALDPAFAAALESGLTTATELAGSVETLNGYLYLLMSYVNALPDAHVSVWGARDNPEWNTAERTPTVYPGFTTAWRNGRFLVHDALLNGDIQDGWALVSCEGMSAEALAEANLFTTLGDAAQPADWARFAPLLFIDQGAPGFVRPQTCLFDGAPGDGLVPLPWQEISMREIGPAIQDAGLGEAPQAGIRTVAGGGLWVSLPSFSADAIPSAVAVTMQGTLEEGRDAPYVVFDLRGNGGGNSFVADGYATALFGLWATVQRLDDGWEAPADLIRASEGNRTWFADFAARANDAATRAYLQSLVAAIESAMAEGDALASVGGGMATGPRPLVPPPAYAGQVFVLTDGSAFSSTLLFVDLVLRYPNARHVGWPTRAHGLYGELRQVPLPSGWAVLGFSTKAFMARSETADQPFVPDLVWDGEIADTPALEAWIAGLAGVQ